MSNMAQVLSRVSPATISQEVTFPFSNTKANAIYIFDSDEASPRGRDALRIWGPTGGKGEYTEDAGGCPEGSEA